MGATAVKHRADLVCRTSLDPKQIAALRGSLQFLTESLNQAIPSVPGDFAS